MQYLIDRGIDMTIEEYRWDSNAAGWARYGNNDEKMAGGWRRRNESSKENEHAPNDLFSWSPDSEPASLQAQLAVA